MNAPELAMFDQLDDATEMAADAEGMADFEAGRTISHKAMTAWLLSWGTDKELPPPRAGD